MESVETCIRNLGEKTKTNPPHLDGFTLKQLSFNVYFSIYFTAGSRECETVLAFEHLFNEPYPKLDIMPYGTQLVVQMVSLLLILVYKCL